MSGRYVDFLLSSGEGGSRACGDAWSVELEEVKSALLGIVGELGLGNMAEDEIGARSQTNTSRCMVQPGIESSANEHLSVEKHKKKSRT